ncbi:hypothetical protein, partial [Vibrio sp.]|uniref:hypothetical protein n=1 Tax=Vibrio sp. TaxID=678 RepID=UPI00378893BD
NGIISHAVYLSVNRSGENTSTDYTATPSSFHTPEIIIALIFTINIYREVKLSFITTVLEVFFHRLYAFSNENIDPWLSIEAMIDDRTVVRRNNNQIIFYTKLSHAFR